MKTLNTKLLGLLLLLLGFTPLFSQQITLLSPNGGESYDGGSKHDITWTSSGVDTLRLSYSLDNGATWVLIGSNILAASGSYNWWLPINQPSKNCKIRIEDKNNTSIKDSSDNQFTIESYIIITSPKGGETLFSSRQFTITWTSAGTGSFNILFTIDNGLSFSSIGSNVNPADSSYTWNVPLAVTEKGRIFIRSGSVNAENVSDTSDGLFTIVSTVGINEYGVSNEPKVYPNPSNGTINIEFENRMQTEPVTFKVVDILGKEVFTTSASNFGNTITLDLTDSVLTSGIYFLTISEGKPIRLYINK